VSNFELIGAEPDLQVVSGNIVYDAERVTARASKSGVVFTILVVNRQFSPDYLIDFADLVRNTVEAWAAFWDMNAAVPGVVAIGLAQEVDDAGQLSDVANVIVSSTSGRSTMQQVIRPAQFMPSDFKPVVESARAQLDKLESFGPVGTEAGLTSTGVVVDIGGGTAA
jgi:hypothetical protein